MECNEDPFRKEEAAMHRTEKLADPSIVPLARSTQAGLAPKFQDLIPIVMVIVGGCETCAEELVTRALQEGSSWQDIDKTLRIVADMQGRECFANAVGADVVARMEKPLLAGRRTLQELMTAAR